MQSRISVFRPTAVVAVMEGKKLHSSEVSGKMFHSCLFEGEQVCFYEWAHILYIEMVLFIQYTVYLRGHIAC